MTMPMLRLAAAVLAKTVCIAWAAVAGQPQDPGDQSETLRWVTAADLLSLRDINGLSVSADGRHVAFQLRQADVATNSFRLGWYIADTTTGQQIRHVGDGGEPIMTYGPTGVRRGVFWPDPAQWSPDGRWIVYRLQRGGEVQLWRSSRDGAVQEQLTHNAADILSFAWAPDGSRIFFTVGQSRAYKAKTEQEEGERGYVFDASFDPTYAPRPLWGVCMDHPFNRMPESRACTPTLWVLDLQTGDERQATPDEQAVYESLEQVDGVESAADTRDIRSVYRSSDGTKVAWLENADPVSYPGAGAPLTIFASLPNEERCLADECRGYFSDLWWRQDLTELIFVRNQGAALGAVGFYAWQPGKAAVRTILETDDQINDCHFRNDRVICLRAGPTRPARVVSIDLIDGVERTLVDPNPEFRSIGFTRVRKIEWKDGFGNDTFGHLVYPAGYRQGQRYPLVIVQYRSRGFLRGGTGNEYPIHLLAANGFAVLSFDRPRDWQNMGKIPGWSEDENKDSRWLYKRRRALTALEIVVDRLVDEGIVDPDRVGITGLSDGAETTFFSLIHSDRFAAAATSGGVWAPGTFDLKGHSAWRGFMQEIGLGQLGGAHDSNWSDLAVTLNAPKVQAPILMQVAEHELLSGLSSYMALNDADKPVEMLVFPDEYHVKWQPKHRYNIYRRNVQWFKFWFMEQEDPDPVDPGQYVRWQKLRERHQANLKALEQVQRPTEPHEAQTTAGLGGE